MSIMNKELLNDSSLHEVKINEFQTAMDRYHNRIFYQKIGLFVSLLVVSLQITTAIQFYQLYPLIHPVKLILPFILAYLLADFISGLAHLYMDNNTHYKSVLGPLIAAFHLHHLTPRYTDRHPCKIYFYESGTKYWLVLYLGLLVWIQHRVELPIELNFCLVSFGILSSIAEVSHYCCHSSHNKHRLIQLLQKYRILLCKRHHLVHHITDNKNYAFLNGLTNPLINWIAKHWYEGYKSHADLHAKAYTGTQTKNRS